VVRDWVTAQEALKDSKLSNAQQMRCKNFFALGLALNLAALLIQPTNGWKRNSKARMMHPSKYECFEGWIRVCRKMR